MVAVIKVHLRIGSRCGSHKPLQRAKRLPADYGKVERKNPFFLIGDGTFANRPITEPPDY
jgi:hypothetical protein